MNNKKIIISLAVFLFASFTYLTYVEQKYHDYDSQKDWWISYFNNPKSNDLDFTIENHSGKNNFHWEIFSGKNKPYLEGDIEISKGEKKNVTPELKNGENKKITVKISTGDDSKEIYKNFNK